jgi:hypothetical protein
MFKKDPGFYIVLKKTSDMGFFTTGNFFLLKIMVESGTGVSVCAVRGGGAIPRPYRFHSLAGSVTINAKTTVHCSPDSSMLKMFVTTFFKRYGTVHH